MSMTRKHYQMIADAVADAGLMIQLDHEETDTGRQEAVREVASYLASAMACDNPRFDRDRFLTACKLKAQA